MLRRKNHIVSLVLMVLTLAVMMSFPTLAASKKSQALASYKSYLEGKPSYILFTTLYLNNDSVPELLVNGELYTWKAGQMIKIKNPNESMYVISGYYKKKGVLVQEYAHGGYYPSMVKDYAKLSGYELTIKLEDFKSGEVNTSTGKTKWGHTYHKISTSGSKKISKSAFNKALKKLVKSKKMTKIKTFENTAANRAKKLK